MFYRLRWRMASKRMMAPAMAALRDSVWWAMGMVMGVWAKWRALVLASPAWYPTETAATRNALLSFGERLLNGARFDPSRVEEVLA